MDHDELVRMSASLTTLTTWLFVVAIVFLAAAKVAVYFMRQGRRRPRH